MPKKRPYDQYCPIATALDRVGDRWSLLIVRELLTGPLRYNELLKDLDGLATDVLARRLRELESLDLVDHGDDGYMLTTEGRRLSGVLQALARWGGTYLDEPAVDDELRASRAVQMLAVAKIDMTSRRPTSLELRADDVAYTIRTDAEGTIVRRGIGDGVDDGADCRITTDGPTLWALRQGWISWDQAVESGRLEVDGVDGHAKRLMT